MKEKVQSYSLIILRAALGIVFFARGSQKLLGWFGGSGFNAIIQFFQTQLGICCSFNKLQENYRIT